MNQTQPVEPTPSSADAADPAPAAAFPVVGLGASAGGLAAFEAFFRGMPADHLPGMAFVLVQHLSPDHKSILSEIIRRHTRMPVFDVADGMTVKPDCVYIIPPGCDMAILNGTLELLAQAAPRGNRLTIDFFFRSLAQDLHERAIGIVLSGTGCDGAVGVRAIKGEGGMVIAQDPASAEHDGMPRSAIGTGLVDYQLTPEEMPAQLIAYTRHAFGKLPRVDAAVPPNTGATLKKIFILLRARTGHDFSEYKLNTIRRRLERRMAVHQIETRDGYLKYLQQTPAELDALFHDLLIGVTSFFRDPDAFRALEELIVPRLFAGKPVGATIRVWAPGCSSGEEVYSIAMLLREHMDTIGGGQTVQIFATDIDRQAVATARAGLYPASISADLSAERLARFFTAEPDGSAYRIHKNIRDMLIFSVQDVIKDPPFSKVDLISCRNLMIYMSMALQQKLISSFHFALNPGGILFLGTSETVGESDDLFSVLDRRSKLYVRDAHLQGKQRAALGRLLSPTDMGLPQAVLTKAFPPRLPLRELTEQALLRQIAPVGALVNGQGDILYLHGRTGMYLEPAAGEAGINNILKMAREGLLPGLTTTLHKAVVSKEVVHCRGLHVRTNGDFTKVDLTVRPVATGYDTTPEAMLYLVILMEAVPVTPELAQQAALLAGADVPETDPRIAALKEALRAQDDYLRSANEEREAANEHLRASNEELQSVNEELQSTNEEMETSKEELQSVNEELATVNTELQNKVVDLARANNDMNNLLAATGVGTVFVDHQLRILRFTPEARVIINLIAGDEGRPVAHIATNLIGYDRLVQDAQAVLDTLVPHEAEVQTRAGKWYCLRIQPYRTIDNVIEGAVITFGDITALVHTREALQQANSLLRLSVVARDAHAAISVHDLEGRILAWNPGAQRMYGWCEAEALLMNVRDRIPAGLQAEALDNIHRLSLAANPVPCRTRRLTRDAKVVDIWLTATALMNETGKMYAIATTERAAESETDRLIEGA